MNPSRPERYEENAKNEPPSLGEASPPARRPGLNEIVNIVEMIIQVSLFWAVEGFLPQHPGNLKITKQVVLGVYRMEHC